MGTVRLQRTLDLWKCNPIEAYEDVGAAATGTVGELGATAVREMHAGEDGRVT